jgi:hypothetical protein
MSSILFRDISCSEGSQFYGAWVSILQNLREMGHRAAFREGPQEDSDPKVPFLERLGAFHELEVPS